MDEMDRAPESGMTFAEEEEIKQANRVAQQIHREAYPSPLLGYAIEHSIEDPFTGEITVSVRLV